MSDRLLDWLKGNKQLRREDYERMPPNEVRKVIKSLFEEGPHTNLQASNVRIKKLLSF